MEIKFMMVAALMLLGAGAARAQYAHFPVAGTIEYEKTVHVKNFMKRHLSMSKDEGFDRTYIEQLMAKAPDSYVFKNKMMYNGSESRYEPIKEERTGIMRSIMWFGFDYETTYYKDIKNGVFRSVADYVGSNILTQDSLLKVKWKITDEYRTIAGYNCRRANGVVLDSVFIVAFYTDEIPLSSGPGAFHGLPGMILGVAVPEQHYNIYATKVNFIQPQVMAEMGKKKDKPMTRAELKTFLYDRMRVGDWNTEQQFNFLLTGLYL